MSKQLAACRTFCHGELVKRRIRVKSSEADAAAEGMRWRRLQRVVANTVSVSSDIREPFVPSSQLSSSPS